VRFRRVLSSKVYNVLKGIDRFLPVDVHYSRMSTRPEALIDAFMTLQKKIEAQTLWGPNRPALLGPKRGERVSNAGVRRTRFGAAVQPGSLASAPDGAWRVTVETLEQIKAGSRPRCLV